MICCDYHGCSTHKQIFGGRAYYHEFGSPNPLMNNGTPSLEITYASKRNHYCRKGLQSQTAARTAKLAILPIASPPTRQKVSTVAATSTSSLRPFSLGLCSKDGADIIHRLETWPFENPNTSKMNMYRISELMMGDGGSVEERWMLHMRNRGMKSVRAKESVSSRLADQMTKRG